MIVYARGRHVWQLRRSASIQSNSTEDVDGHFEVRCLFLLLQSVVRGDIGMGKEEREREREAGYNLSSTVTHTEHLRFL